MLLRVSPWETYIRTTTRRVVAWLIIGWLLVATLWRQDWWGVLLLISVVWWYAYYQHRTRHEVELLTLTPQGIQIEWTNYFWNSLQWFSVWYDQQNLPQTLYLYTIDDVLTYSLIDDLDTRINAIQQLHEYLPYSKHIHLDTIKKILRYIKI